MEPHEGKRWPVWIYTGRINQPEMGSERGIELSTMSHGSTECLDHLLIFQKKQLLRVLNAYVASFNQARPHQGIGQQIPQPSRSALSSHHAGEKVIALPVVGGLHHDYRWAA